MYWIGARLDAGYSLSIPFDEQAMNITPTSNAGNLDFGLAAATAACRNCPGCSITWRTPGRIGAGRGPTSTRVLPVTFFVGPEPGPRSPGPV
ncbi:WS/DGAT domain-containing protein [Nocardia sp. R6R-6]|uniref:WS/DGAT domain-containing protein n=1 Tax=Nocardia sp. R6R-6 TaxID=3459303 RepID=UPI00403D8473